jgi:hypothetical protein
VSAERIYANRPAAKRANVSLVVVIGSFLFGLFEIWRAVQVSSEASQTGYLFALLFIGGGAYGLHTILAGHRDTVLWLDVEGSDATAGVWRPFGAARIAGPLRDLTEFRPYAKPVRRNVTVPTLLADHPARPRPLEFDLGPGIEYGEAFRSLAGEAISSFEKPAAAPA